MPFLLTVSPSEAEVDASGVTLTLNGNGFNGTSVVNFGNSAHSPSATTATEMTVEIPASDLTGAGVAVDGPTVASVFVDANTMTFDLAAGTPPGDHDVTVTNAGSPTSNSVTVRVTRPPPEVLRVVPGSGVAGREHDIDVIGKNFADGAEILVDGRGVQTRFNAPTSLSGTIPSSGPGTLAISVENPGGVESNAVNFTLTAAPNPAPHILSVIQAGDTVTVSATGLIPETEVFLDGVGIAYTRVDASTLTIVAHTLPDGSHTVKLVNPPSAGGGGGTSTFSFTSGTSNEIIVFNDVNIFDSVGMDSFYEEAPGGANPNNTLLARNLVSFTSSGSRNSGTVVQFDCGRSSGYTTACSSETDLMKAEFTSAGLTTTVVNSSSGSMTSIPSNVKVLFLWMPRVAFNGVEINTMKQFLADGGRIVFAGEHSGFYDSISTVANVFLKDMGTKSLIKGGAFDCSDNTLPAASLNTTGHQVMTGLTGLEHACASEINPLNAEDTVLFKERDDSDSTKAGTAVLAAALKTTTDSIPTGAPTLTSISPGSVVAGQNGVVMTLTGTDFTPGSGVTVSGGFSVSITDTTYVSSTTLQVTINIDSGTSGPYAFQVSNANGSSATSSFTIVTDRASVTSVTPNSEVQGATVPITIIGTQFTGATSVNVSGSGGVLVGGFSVVSDTQIDAVLFINEPAVTRFISVTNAAGSANAVSFMITSNSIAGSGPFDLEAASVAGSQGFGTEDGAGPAAAFNTPNGSVVYNNNLYVADFLNHTIRQIVIATGVVTTLAGSAGNSGMTDGTGTAARFNGPVGVAAEGTTDLFVGDRLNHTIRKIQISSQAVSTFAGTAGSSGFVEGNAGNSRFNRPGFVSIAGGTLYVSDELNHAIRQTNLPGVSFSTLAGSPNPKSGKTDETGAKARFNFPGGTWGDGKGNLYVSDTNNHTIRKVVLATGAVTTFAGVSGTSGANNGPGATATFQFPEGLWGDGLGNLYVADTGNHRIRKIVIATQQVSTLAGSGSPALTNGTGTGASFNSPHALWGDAGTLYVADKDNNVIRKIVVSSGAVTTFGGTGVAGSSDNATGTLAQFDLPLGIWGDGSSLYVTEGGNHTIRKIEIGGTQTVTTIAGGSVGSDDGIGAAAKFNFPHAIWGDGTNLWVVDSDNHTIRQVVISSATVTTPVGSAGNPGFVDDTGSTARFSTPQTIWGNGSNLYVSDGNNHQIRKLSFAPG